MNLLQRISEPTPPWWKKVRNISASLAAIGGVLIALPVALPAGIVAAIPYLTTVFTAIAGTAQCAKEKE